MKRTLSMTIGGLVLGASLQPITAAECQQNFPSNSLVCRTLSQDYLDQTQSYCFYPDKFDARAIKQLGKDDPWTTKRPIDLGLNTGSGPQGKCSPAIDFSDAQLTIGNPDSKGVYPVKVTKVKIAGSKKFRVLRSNMELQLDRNGDGLWLSGTDAKEANLKYFVFFRNLLANNELPKFLVIEAFDTDDGHCAEDAPDAIGNVVRDVCPSTAAGQRTSNKGDLSGLAETGVGGGGEGKP